MRVIFSCLAVLQNSLLRLSYAVHRWGHRGRAVHGYVVGMEEIAGLLTAIAASLDDAVTVNLARNALYEHRYDIEFNLRGTWQTVNRLRRLVAGPWLLGRLTARHQTFIYLGGQGFLNSLQDGRERELSFLKARGRTVVCYFAGSDIRSHVLLNAYAAERGIDVITTFQPQVAPGLATRAADDQRRALAVAADRHASLIFNAAVDQMSYIQRRTEPCMYFYPDELIRRRPEKWLDPSCPVVVHAPSSPIIKGTPLVHAAVKALLREGYDFEYVEILNRPHVEVLAMLERAHVVLNQFYAFLPGVFGIEGMAANAVLLNSADGDIEPTLPPDANEAWVVTPYWRIYDNLKSVLDRPGSMQAQADRGTAWVARHCSRSANTTRLLSLLDGSPL